MRTGTDCPEELWLPCLWEYSVSPKMVLLCRRNAFPAFHNHQVIQVFLLRFSYFISRNAWAWRHAFANRCNPVTVPPAVCHEHQCHRLAAWGWANKCCRHMACVPGLLHVQHWVSFMCRFWAKPFFSHWDNTSYYSAYVGECLRYVCSALACSKEPWLLQHGTAQLPHTSQFFSVWKNWGIDCNSSQTEQF